MRIIVNTNVFTPHYLTAMETLLEMAGFYVDEKDENGEIAIYTPDENSYTEAWILEILRNCDLI